tara:strand:+ start:9252 stop:9608 length:357 start_codon:yes stop_codon:yes gene_type:complete
MSKTFNPKIVKQLVLPVLKMNVDEPIYVKFIDAVMEKEKVEKDENGADKHGTIQIGHVIELRDGEEFHMVIGSVLLSTLTESYVDASYVDKCFMITKLAKKGSGARGYHPYLLAEIEL